jgi:hypothetical protein
MSWEYFASSAAGCVLIGIWCGTAMLFQRGIRRLWRKLRGIPVFYDWKQAKAFGEKAALAVLKDIGMEGNSALQDSVAYRAASAIYEYAEAYEMKAF